MERKINIILVSVFSMFTIQNSISQNTPCGDINFSDLTTHVINAVTPTHIEENSPVPDSLLCSDNNELLEIMVDGPEIFETFSEYIALAKYEVDMVFFGWHKEADANYWIGKGLNDAYNNLSATDILLVRIIVNESRVGLDHNIGNWRTVYGWDDRMVFQEIVYENGLDPRNSVHDKYIVVDSKYVGITGGNIQDENNRLNPNRWREIGLMLQGDIAYSSYRSFINLYERIIADNSDLQINLSTPEGITTIDRNAGTTPMVALGRKYQGIDNDNDDNSQNQAWLALMNNAQTSINILTPNINDDKFQDAIVGAVNRGVEVKLITSYGFNDLKESYPFQGGGNYLIIGDLRQRVNNNENLKIRWFSKNGITTQINHAKFMSVDGQVAVIGSGNMDTQSWNHSNEYNILIDNSSDVTDINNAFFNQDFQNSLGSFFEFYMDYNHNGLPEIAVMVESAMNNRILEIKDIGNQIPGFDIPFLPALKDIEISLIARDNRISSAIIRDVPEGKIFRLYDDNVGKDLNNIIRKPWIEVRVLNDLIEYEIPSLEIGSNVYNNGDISVHSHGNPGDFFEKASALEVADRYFGPVIDFYEDNNFLFSNVLYYNISTDLTYQQYNDELNDRANSAKLYDIPKGMTINIYNHTVDDTGNFGSDYLEIQAMIDLPFLEISNLELSNLTLDADGSYNHPDYRLTYHGEGNLNGEVSTIQVPLCSRMRDSLALVEFHNVTDGPNWSTPWILEQPMSNWTGVALNAFGCVESLTLIGKGLNGIIPSGISNIQGLEYIYLQDNDLTGSIPLELTYLPLLKNLDLSNNNLTGNLEIGLVDFSNIELLNVANNKLSGCIPLEFYEGFCLKNVDVNWSGNQLIENEGGFYTFCNEFNGLCFAGTSISSPCEADSLALVSIFEATNGPSWTTTWDLSKPMNTWHGVVINSEDCVTGLHLNNNNLSGSFPAAVGDLLNLSLLTLTDNQLTGAIPSELGNLVNLRMLFLSDNQLTGAIPPELGNLANLNYLFLRNNQLSGCLPFELEIFCDNVVDISNNPTLFNDDFNDFCANEEGSCNTCSYRDSLILVDLHNATTSASNFWDLSQPMSTWHGVTTDADGCVTTLIRNDLGGSLPASIGDLEELEILVLNGYNNYMEGSLPSELGQLKKLKRLELYGHRFSGSIPTEIGGLWNLEYLALDGDGQLSTYYGNLSGAIPYQLGYLWNLEYLSLRGNKLSSIPIGLGNLINLKEMNLNVNELTGSIPFDFGNLSDLEFLYLSINQLTGTIPPELGNLSSLVHFYASRNQLSGSIPPEIGNILTLRKFSAQNNQLTGSIPVELGNLSNLESLQINSNQLSGMIPSTLGNLSALEILWLHDNQLSGTIPPEIGNLSILDKLNLNDNLLTGIIPPELGNLPEYMHSVYLRNNNLSGCFDIALSSLCSATFTDFSNNPNLEGGGDFDAFCTDYTGICPCFENCPCDYIDQQILVALYNATDGANWTNTWDLSQPMDTWYGVVLNDNGCVRYLNLANNNLVGLLPTEIGNLSSVEALLLRSNQLSGSIPSSFGNLTNLTYVELNQNNLSGAVPNSIGNLVNVTAILLQENNFTSVPASIANMTALNELHLENNLISGPIPPEFGSLNTNYLNLSNNQFSGSIPPEFINLSNPGYLNISNNQLTGSIPPELGSVGLGWLEANDNLLSGCFDDALSPLCNIGAAYFFNNPDLPGGGDFDAFCTNQTGACTCDTPVNTNHLLISGNVVKITWDAVSYATRYRVRYRTQGGSWIERLTGGIETFRFLNELTPNTFYEYQIKALCSSQNSVWSSTKNFTTPADYCNIPTGIGINSISGEQATAVWTPSPDDIKYKIKYKQIGTPWIEVIINNTAYTMTGLLPAMEYKYKVKTKCTLGWTNWSAKYLFTTPDMVSRKIDTTTKSSIEVFPNPTKGLLNVKLKNSFSQLLIRDVNGKIVKSLDSNLSMQAVELSDFADGIYYLLGITEKGEVEYKKFVKTH